MCGTLQSSLSALRASTTLMYAAEASESMSEWKSSHTAVRFRLLHTSVYALRSCAVQQ